MSLFAKTPSVVKINGIQIQSAVSALPIPIIYGAPRVPCNIIYANGFKAVKQKQSGGKGLLSGGKGGSANFLYYATLIAAIGEGPIQNIIEIYQDTNQYFNLSGIREVDPNNQTGKSGQPNYVPTNAQFFPGGPNQIPWGYITGRWPTDARTYKDTCYIGLPNMQLDASATPPQLNFVPRGIFSGTCPLNPAFLTGTYTDNNGQHKTQFEAGLIDADPALVVHDFLTNSLYGAGFPATLIDVGLFTSPQGFDVSSGDASFQTYCQAIGFGWSVVLNNSEAAGSVLDRWMRNTATAIVWTGETLKFIPYLGSNVNANPGWDSAGGVAKKYYTPNTTPVLALTDAHFLQASNVEEEPVTLDRVDPIDVYNYFRVSFRDRTNQFNDNVAEESDEVQIERFGPRVDLTGQADEFSLFAYAKASATMQLRRSVSIRRRVTFRLAPVFGFLDPMDIVTVTSGTLNDFGVRLISIEEDADGSLTIIAEEFPQTKATAFPTLTLPPPVFYQTNVTVGDINPPAIIEPTSQLLAANNISFPTVLVGLSGGPNRIFDPNWGGARVWASLDNATYTTMNDISGSPIQVGPSVMGYLTATLPAFNGTNPDTGDVLSVDLSESDGELISTLDSIAAQFLPTLCAVIDPDGCYELLSYTTATLTGLNKYNLTGLYRGLYGTPAREHLAPNAQFLRISRPFFETHLPTQFIGQQFYLKFTSFNIYNQAEQDLSEVVAYLYTPNGAGVDFSTNPIFIALAAGMTVDLNNVVGAPIVDLNLGGDCLTQFEYDFGGPPPVTNIVATIEFNSDPAQSSGFELSGMCLADWGGTGFAPTDEFVGLDASQTFDVPIPSSLYTSPVKAWSPSNGFIIDTGTFIEYTTVHGQGGFNPAKTAGIFDFVVCDTLRIWIGQAGVTLSSGSMVPYTGFYTIKAYNADTTTFVLHSDATITADTSPIWTRTGSLTTTARDSNIGQFAQAGPGIDIDQSGNVTNVAAGWAAPF